MSDREEGLVGQFPFIPKQVRAQQKRDALLESGHCLFITKGFEHTTAKEIASHAGVATGTFYRYFSDKRQLLMSLLENQFENLLPPELSWSNSDPETFLASLLESHTMHLNDLGLDRVLLELLPKDLELSEMLTTAKKKIHLKIYKMLEKAKESGITWEDLDLNAVTWAVMLLMDKVHEKEGPIDYHEISKVIYRLVFPPEMMKQLRNGEKEA